MIEDSLATVAADSLNMVKNLPGDINLSWLFIKMLLMLILVIGLIVLISWFAKKYTFFNKPNNPNDWMEIISKAQLGPQKNIYLFRLFEKVIAILETPHNTVILNQWNKDEINFEKIEQEKNKDNNFFHLLKANIKKH